MPDGHYPSPRFLDLILDGIGAVSTSFVLVAHGGVPGGWATLGEDGLVPAVQLPPAVTGTLNLRGTWNATTNTPTLGDSGAGGSHNDYYVVSVAGSTSLDGIASWLPDDWVVHNGSVWQRKPVAGGGSAAFDSIRVPSLSIATTDPTKAFTLTADDTGGADFKIQDGFGYVALVVQPDGTVEAGTLSGDVITGNALELPAGAAVTCGSVVIPDFTMSDIPDGVANVYFGDEFGFLSLVISADGTVSGGGSGGGGGGGGGGGDDPNSFSSALLAARDGVATALSMAAQDQTEDKTAKPIWKYNHIVSYGQSLAIGSQGFPRLSTSEGLDNLCFGSLPASNTGAGATTFVPFTDSSFHTLDNTQGNEVPAIATTNEWRKLYLRHHNLASDSSKQFVINSCGAGGMSIEELSKGASPNLYNQVIDLVTQANAAAALAGGSYGVVVLYYVQGDSNYFKAGADHTEAGYLALFEQLKSDLTTDIMAITGQADPPLFLTVQAGTSFGSTIDDCAIGNAQITAGTSHSGCYLATPYYMAPNIAHVTNEHLSSDGYRWIGNKCGHLLHKLLDLDRGWAPLHITRATFRGSQLLVQFHTPQPPLQSLPCYLDTSSTTTFDDLGFTVGDDFGGFTIRAVEVLNSTILLTLDRAMSADANPWVQYGDFTTHGGNGNVCDSDPFSPLDIFTTTGLPYPGFNWLAGARVSVVADT
jgi:hypothetical protein